MIECTNSSPSTPIDPVGHASDSGDKVNLLSEDHEELLLHVPRSPNYGEEEFGMASDLG